MHTADIPLYYSPMPPEKKRKQAPFGCLFWIAFILLVFVLFFANKDRITNSVRALQESGFFARGEEVESAPNLTPQTRENDGTFIEIIPETAVSAESGSASDREEETSSAQGASADAPPSLTELVPPPSADEVANAASGMARQTAQTASGEESSSSVTGEHVPMRQQRLYFVSIDNEGRVLRQEVLKDIPRSDSPLADALAALFAGPSEAESQRGLISLIPSGTRLLSAAVRDGVATISLSEEFRFNQFGVEGAISQLAQVVFTATTFPTVNSVQILIEGQKLEYLGAEGVWIGTPLSRKDFN